VGKGAGFDLTSQARGAGMTNMMDRVGAVGGSLRVDSSPGHGTTGSGIIPLRTAAASKQASPAST
jgi:signal transduction histidine kinase